MRLINVPSWLQSDQEIARHKIVSVGFPEKREEAWRYSPVDLLRKSEWVPTHTLAADQSTFEIPNELAALARDADGVLCFYNGEFLPAASKSSFDEAKIVAPLSRVLMSAGRVQEIAKFYLQREPNPKLKAYGWKNQAEFKEGAFIQLKPNEKTLGPQKVLILHMYGSLLNVESQQNFSCHPRSVILGGAGANVEIMEVHVATNSLDFFVNSATDVWLDKGAKVKFGQVQWLGEAGISFSDLQVHVAAEAQLDMLQYVRASRVSRNEATIQLNDPGASARFNTLSEAHGQTHVDNSTFIRHLKGFTKSEQAVKQLAFGESKSVFSGRLLIDQDAQKSDASQMNHNILMSDLAEADARPQLEVNADDVKATHGATVGRLQDDELFYLMSRGLSREHATTLLTDGFKLDLLNRLERGFVRDSMARFIQRSDRLVGDA